MRALESAATTAARARGFIKKTASLRMVMKADVMKLKRRQGFMKFGRKLVKGGFAAIVARELNLRPVTRAELWPADDIGAWRGENSRYGHLPFDDAHNRREASANLGHVMVKQNYMSQRLGGAGTMVPAPYGDISFGQAGMKGGSCGEKTFTEHLGLVDEAARLRATQREVGDVRDGSVALFIVDKEEDAVGAIKPVHRMLGNAPHFSESKKGKGLAFLRTGAPGCPKVPPRLERMVQRLVAQRRRDGSKLRQQVLVDRLKKLMRETGLGKFKGGYIIKGKRSLESQGGMTAAQAARRPAAAKRVRSQVASDIASASHGVTAEMSSAERKAQIRASQAARATKEALQHSWLEEWQMQMIYDNPNMGPTELGKLIGIHKPDDRKFGARVVAGVRTRAKGRDRGDRSGWRSAKR